MSPYYVIVSKSRFGLTQVFAQTLMLQRLLSSLRPEQIDRLRRLRQRYRKLIPLILPKQQAHLRAACNTVVKRYVDAFCSYSPAELESCLRSLGLKTGDTLLLHSSFKQFSGFHGSLDELINTFLRIVSREGNLMMVSMPYTTYTYEYLRQPKVFDVRRTPSLMGLVSEAFRRRKGVLRSLHPTHPVLVSGPKAEWIVDGHESTPYPCGFGTPFEKLAMLNGKILFFDASFFTNTFYHYLEEIIKDKLPFPLYAEQPFVVPVVDYQGCQRSVKTYVYSMEAIERRKPEILQLELQKRGWFHQTRIGNSKIVLIEAAQAVSCVKEMAEQGVYFYSEPWDV